jgi:hypothetical protein
MLFVCGTLLTFANLLKGLKQLLMLLQKEIGYLLDQFTFVDRE